MLDLRKFNDEVRTCVRELNRQPVNGWRWSVRSVGKDLIRLGWGYLDYLGEKDSFKIHADEYGNDDFLTCENAGGGNIGFVDIGNDRWSEAKTVDEAVKMAIEKIAYFANSRY